VNTDLAPLAADLGNRVILVTGAAGSIGSELARQIAPFGPARLVLLDRAESELNSVHLDLNEAHPSLDLAPVICDITNAASLAQVFARHRFDYVVHAAAYKHVPFMEENAQQAVRNNVLGTLLVATTAVRYGTRKFLLVSTDSVIRPVSLIEATKRIAERIIFGLPNLHRTGTDFRAVRVGNVQASKDNILSLLQRQLAASGPGMTIHRRVNRYFMTLEEAAQLVLQAGCLAETADGISMLRMGDSLCGLDVAEHLIRYPSRLGRDASNGFTSLQPGEKLAEVLIAALQATVPTANPKIRISQTTEQAEPELLQKLSRLLAYLDARDPSGLLQSIRDLVPECVSPLAEPGVRQASISEPIAERSPRAWRMVLASSAPKGRDRREGRVRLLSKTDELTMEDRRQGLECRRKEARAGGRRRADVSYMPPAEPFSTSKSGRETQSV
jgi:FlaA1/EpsC-like NDP-sugar epimerase